jgi:hypothetical protein
MRKFFYVTLITFTVAERATYTSNIFWAFCPFGNNGQMVILTVVVVILVWNSF